MTEWQIGLFGAMVAIIAYQTYELANYARKMSKRLDEIAWLLRKDKNFGEE